MRKPILLACLAALIAAFTLAEVSPAADPAPRRAGPPRKGPAPARRAAPPARKLPVKTYDFTADAIDGERILPDGVTVFGLRGARFPSLIDVRGDFLHEVTRSADRLP